jgi:DUF1016 N-terminal domain
MVPRFRMEIRMSKMTVIPPNYDSIRGGIVELLKTARSAAARNVNSIMTATYWEIGRRIVELDQAGKRRADYGDLLIRKLATDLSTSFGRGFGARNLARCGVFTWPGLMARFCRHCLQNLPRSHHPMRRGLNRQPFKLSQNNFGYHGPLTFDCYR